MGPRVVIVGGGFAGLFTAVELLERGIDDVVVLDREASPGGVARTIRRDGFALEPAAGSLLLPHPHLTDVLDHVGAESVPAVDAGIRYVYTRGRLVALSPSPKAILAPLVPWSAKLRAALEPFVRTPPGSEDESVDEFLRRRIGDGLGRTLAWVAASGVFAGDPSRLSARSAFPAFPALEDSAGSIVRGAIRRMRGRSRTTSRPTGHVPVGGMTAVAEAAARRLGDRYRSGFEVGSVGRADGGWRIDGPETLETEHLVVAIRPTAAGRVLGGELGALLEKATSVPAVVVGLGGPADRLPLPPGFGALMGPDAGTAALGILFESSYAPERAPTGHSLAKIIAGGARNPDVVEWDDERIVDQVGSEVARVLDCEVEASFVEIVRHEPGIPQYEVGHSAWLAAIDGMLPNLPGLHLTGWGYRGIGVGHLAADAVRLADVISSDAG